VEGSSVQQVLSHYNKIAKLLHIYYFCFNIKPHLDHLDTDMERIMMRFNLEIKFAYESFCIISLFCICTILIESIGGIAYINSD